MDGAQGRDRNVQEVQDSKAKWDRRTQGQKSATFASEVPPNEVVGGAVAARIKAYSSESQHSSSRGWRIGDVLQDRAGGRVFTYRLTYSEVIPVPTHPVTLRFKLVWRGNCAICGERFMAISGRDLRGLARTCLDHRAEWEERAASAEGAANG